MPQLAKLLSLHMFDCDCDSETLTLSRAKSRPRNRSDSAPAKLNEKREIVLFLEYYFLT
jgi:hypothetical protein